MTSTTATPSRNSRSWPGSPGSHSDVLIVGAGPAGLSLAIALGQAGFMVTVVEQQPLSALAAPAPDGREIALTHPSRAMLQRLGTWPLLAPHETGTIAQAQVHDGPLGQRSALQLDARRTGDDALGFIAPNHALRRTAYAVAAQTPGVRIVTGAQATRVAALATHAELEYRLPSDPAQRPGTDSATPMTERLLAPLLVAADSRFSATRRQLGIGARMEDFGRTVIVCRMRHTRPQGGVAHECFGYERTLAILPLPDALDASTAADAASARSAIDADHALRVPAAATAASRTTAARAATSPHQCSVVITASAADAAALLALPADAFTAQVQAQFKDRLGPMQLNGDRHAYPLVAVYADRFAAHRCALLGDAAVGMHPVTAHGFNLGLAGVDGLAATLQSARRQGTDIGHLDVLATYARAHHHRAWPIYQGTNAIVRLYTDARPLPRLLRQLVLQGARRLPPLQAAIVGQLTGKPPGWMRPQPLRHPATLQKTKLVALAPQGL